MNTMKKQLSTPIEKLNSLNPSEVRLSEMTSISSRTRRMVSASPFLNWAMLFMAMVNLRATMEEVREDEGLLLSLRSESR